MFSNKVSGIYFASITHCSESIWIKDRLICEVRAQNYPTLCSGLRRNYITLKQCPIFNTCVLVNMNNKHVGHNMVSAIIQPMTINKHLFTDVCDLHDCIMA